PLQTSPLFPYTPLFRSDADPDTANNGASISFTINEPPPDSADLVLSLSPSASQFITGENLVMTYAVSNQGPNDATTVSVIHELRSEEHTSELQSRENLV